jgi:glucose/arabinose dehydrogenase
VPSDEAGGGQGQGDGQADAPKSGGQRPIIQHAAAVGRLAATAAGAVSSAPPVHMGRACDPLRGHVRLYPLLLLSLLLVALACTPAAPSRPTAERERESAASGRRQPAVSRPPGGHPGPTPVPRPLAGGLKTELVADGLNLPANLTFAPDGRLFLTEISLGRVRIIDRGTLLPEPFAQVDPASRPENGLLGLTLDPEFPRNGYVYLYYSQSNDDKPLRNRVVRFTDSGGKGTDMQVVMDGLPVANWRYNGGHNGGRLAFGGDGKLYVTVGDVGETKSAQQPDKLSGKLLRVNRDGSLPADNPSPGSPVYALGLRNAWGLAFHPLTGVPYVTENGDVGHDEVDRVEPGGNYRSPESGLTGDARFVDPIWDSGPEGGGISGITFYTGDLFPQYKNDLLFCIWNGGRLMRLRLGGASYDRVEQEEVLSDQCFLDVANGPDGAIYISSINKVQRLVPDR